MNLTDRALDALVAEKVMGEPMPTDVPDDIIGLIMRSQPSPGGAWVCVVRYADGDVPTWEPRRFSANIAAAWEVVEKILELTHPCPYPAPKYTGRGFRLEKRTEDQDDCDVWLCRLPETTAAPPHEEMTYGVSAEDKSAPRAICLAALRAIGVEV